MFLLLLLLLSHPLNEPIHPPELKEVQVADLVQGLTETQLEQVKIIEHVFEETGLEDNIIAAAVVNAWAESRLNPEAVGDSGSSVGLFQLNKNGLGHRLTTEDRKNPYLNAQVVALQIKKNKKLVDMEVDGASIPQLAMEFSTQIMRPRDNQGARSHRWKVAHELFPKL